MAFKLDMPKMKMDQRVTGREKLFFVAALVGMLIMFVNLAWTPQAAEIVNLKNQATEVGQQIDALEQLIESTQQQLAIEQSAPKKEVKLDEYTRKLLERRVVDPLAEIHQTIGQLTSRRIARGVKVDDVEVGDTIDQEAYSVVPLVLHVRGRYGAVLNYLAALKTIGRPLIVKQFRLSREGGKVGKIDVTADMELFISKR